MHHLRTTSFLLVLFALVASCGDDTSRPERDAGDAPAEAGDIAIDPTQPDQPADPATDPVSDPTEPDQPADQATDPVSDPTEPDQPADPATDPVSDPTEPDQPADPATDPVADQATDADQADVEIPPPPDCGDWALVTREGWNDEVSFRLDRCMPQICGGGCPVSSPQLIVVTAQRTYVATSEVIVYTQTHHNWLDSLVATLSDCRITWRVEFTFEEQLLELHYIAIETLDGTPILEETVFEIDPF
ncbi:MAG: hypothetical protein JW797_16200 [Bradymonadales bacterium]|nr:hypothetical protein [Bradymonadales bacterium]